MDPILEGLNDAQRQVVTSNDGACLVIAGAGSGKTRVITTRIAWLIKTKQISASNIFAATFTNKAAEEMKMRVKLLLSDITYDGYLRIGTFHSQCAHMLRSLAPAIELRPDFIIVDENDQLRVLRGLLRREGLDDKRHNPRQILSAISMAKMQLQSYEDMEKDAIDAEDRLAAKIRQYYDSFLHNSNAVDFDDLIYYVVQIFHEHTDMLDSYAERYQYVLIDEYQDTNQSQFELTRLLSSYHKNVMVVGDEDQSIYSWRGADIRNILEFQKNFENAKIMRLEQNYRSTKNILRLANEVIVNNQERIGKTLYTLQTDNYPVMMMITRRETDEAKVIAQAVKRLITQTNCKPCNIAIFYRINALSRTYEDALRAENIDYKVIGGLQFYNRAEIRDIVAYLQLIHNPNNNIALRRCINVPKRGIGQKTLEVLFAHSEEKHLSAYEIITSNQLVGILPKGTVKKLEQFALMITGYHERVDKLKPSVLLKELLKELAFEEYLKNSYNDIEAEGKIENVESLLSSLVESEESDSEIKLCDWLERITLAQDNEDEEKDSPDKISLMTMHAAKGLEFDVVFLPALEDGIFPGARSIAENRLDEERRLFYVAITRAKKILILSRSITRMLYGEIKYNMPSGFLSEINIENFEAFTEAQLCKPFITMSGNYTVKSINRGRYNVNDKVVHPTLGNGIITDIEDTGQKLLTIKFDSGQVLQMAEKYAKIKKI